MMPRANDLVRLARLDATVTEDPSAVHTRHDNHGTAIVWKRSHRPIGQGGFGAVYREECVEGHDQGLVRAVKAIQKTTSRTSPRIDYSQELEAIARFSQSQYQQHFVRSFGWYENDFSIFIAMEFVEQGDLQQYVGLPMPEDEMQLIVSQVLEGLSHMHNLNYAHRDLKPANLLIFCPRPQWHIKIADFGLSKRVAEDLSSLHTRAGTSGYMAPEVQGILTDDGEDSDDQSRPSYTNAVDIWALGVITYQLLGTQLPFPAGDLRPLKRYVNGKAPFPLEHLEAEHISTAGIAWIQSCLAPGPIRRPSAGFSRGHRWPLGAASDTGTARQSRRPTAYASVASVSWSAQDSGYETSVHDPRTDPPQGLTPPAQAHNGVPAFVRATSDDSDPVMADRPTKESLKFKDAMGRTFSFPWSICKTWRGMEALIRQAFMHIDKLDDQVCAGHFDLTGPDGAIVLPQVWESLVQPDWEITMYMWPVPEELPYDDLKPPPNRSVVVSKSKGNKSGDKKKTSSKSGTKGGKEISALNQWFAGGNLGR